MAKLRQGVEGRKAIRRYRALVEEVGCVTVFKSEYEALQSQLESANAVIEAVEEFEDSTRPSDPNTILDTEEKEEELNRAGEAYEAMFTALANYRKEVDDDQG